MSAFADELGEWCSEMNERDGIGSTFAEMVAASQMLNTAPEILALVRAAEAFVNRDVPRREFRDLCEALDALDEKARVS